MRKAGVDSGCSSTPSNRWSILGTSSTHLVLLSTTDEDEANGTELCSVLNAYGVSDAIRLDGGHSAGIVSGGALLNPLTPGFLDGGFPPARNVVNALAVSYDPAQMLPPPTGAIIDNGDAGFATSGTPAYLKTVSYGYHGSAITTRVLPGPASDNSATWTPSFPSSQTTEIKVFIPSNYATTTAAHYEVHSLDGISCRTVRQIDYYDTWVSLGIYNLGPGSYLLLRDRTGEAYLSKWVAFDAASFTPTVGPVASPNGTCP